MNLELDNPDDYGPSGLHECVGHNFLTSTAVDVHTSENIEHAPEVVQTSVRHNMTFVKVEMHGLRQSTDDCRYSHRIPCEVHI